MSVLKRIIQALKGAEKMRKFQVVEKPVPLHVGLFLHDLTDQQAERLLDHGHAERLKNGSFRLLKKTPFKIGEELSIEGDLFKAELRYLEEIVEAQADASSEEGSGDGTVDLQAIADAIEELDPESDFAKGLPKVGPLSDIVGRKVSRDEVKAAMELRQSDTVSDSDASTPPANPSLVED